MGRLVVVVPLTVVGIFAVNRSSSAMVTIANNQAGRDYFISVKKTGKVGVGLPALSKTSGKPTAVIAVQLKTSSGEFAGVFGTSLELEELSNKITGIKIGKTGYPFMVDIRGLLIDH